MFLGKNPTFQAKKKTNDEGLSFLKRFASNFAPKKHGWLEDEISLPFGIWPIFRGGTRCWF